ncbi:putative membrane protein [Corynebacterium ulcerans 0102]|uniref:Uncharacterized protein n=1 Tax=Corynebacterium ulcerans FRC58 TaxID=1408268 RepID=A0ABM5U411_CORUL|nr:hypothetical protein CULC22_02006 [Corynebacterium ulcerans BR-AD22]AKN77853.1 Hypothetical protein CulFRC58_1999 [Corynebacterium ulcerans FRC58]KPH74562.1 hypothetical protein AFK72_09500 [Corynebacterium ulcerans]BAM28195.1 putative membrane protein [Corynebacterium ulcerans 0102]OIS05547.1 hypothetical protein BHG00_07670 [Corynebacterium ulcerans]
MNLTKVMSRREKYSSELVVMSQKTYLIRVIGGSTIFFIVSTVIMTFFFSLGRGHIVNFQDLPPWIAAALVSCVSTFSGLREMCGSYGYGEIFGGQIIPLLKPNFLKVTLG